MSQVITNFSKDLSEFTDQVEQYLDNVVQHGTDEQLFIASYLQGHFAVVAGQSSLEQFTEISQFNELMEQSLHKAFTAKELEEDDQKQVWDLWQSFLP
ncbi:YfcL family protein [Paraglaciecola sp. 2405UD69-4]|uniref:YfcL family protein n=1 Tax=Paraglaciecola sp. 2405UD69-4 TaxID=3391836 RepID=UPI0039C9D5CD